VEFNLLVPGSVWLIVQLINWFGHLLALGASLGASLVVLWWFGRLLALETASLVVRPLIGIWGATLVVLLLNSIGCNSGGSAALRHLEFARSPEQSGIPTREIPNRKLCHPVNKRVYRQLALLPRDVESIPGHHWQPRSAEKRVEDIWRHDSGVTKP
jgi:hypothetical protein